MFKWYMRNVKGFPSISTSCMWLSYSVNGTCWISKWVFSIPQTCVNDVSGRINLRRWDIWIIGTIHCIGFHRCLYLFNFIWGLSWPAALVKDVMQWDCTCNFMIVKQTHSSLYYALCTLGNATPHTYATEVCTRMQISGKHSRILIQK